MYVYEITPGGNVATCKQKESIPSEVLWNEISEVPDIVYRDSWRMNQQTHEVYIPVASKRDKDSSLDKDSRMEQISTLTVDSVQGNTYDADKPALAAITQAVTLGNPGELTNWKMANNSVVSVTWEELRDVGRSIGAIHTSLIAVE